MADREELLARLLADPAFRAEFRRDPEGVARRPGLDGFAPDAEPLEALGARESRSSLAGVMFALAAEGVALLALADHADAAPGPRVGMGAAANAPSDETVALLHNHN